MSSNLELWQRLDSELCAMVDNFANLVKAAHIPEPDDAGSGVGGGGMGGGGGPAAAATAAHRTPGELLELWAEKLVHGGHECLRVVADLKKSAVLSDFDILLDKVYAIYNKHTCMYTLV